MKNLILDLLQLHKPPFQLKSGIESLPSSEGFFSTSSQETGHLERLSHAAGLEILKYILEIVSKDSVTLETGGGWSTCVFASAAKKHICINPDITANKNIRSFLNEHRVPFGELEFLNDISDSALPTLSEEVKLDVAFIDGNHSFPIPIIDWHYIDLHLKKDGILLLDDFNVNAVAVLRDYLMLEVNYEHVCDIGKTAVFKKCQENRTWGWADQIFNQVNYKENREAPVRADVGSDELLDEGLINLSSKLGVLSKYKLALYGAGQHTRRFLSKIESSFPHPILQVIDDNASGDQYINGIPIVKPEQLSGVDALVISSDTIEDALYKKAEHFAGETPILKMYS